MRYRTFEVPYEGTVYDVQIAYDDGGFSTVDTVGVHGADITEVINSDVIAYFKLKAWRLARQPVLHEQETMDREGE